MKRIGFLFILMFIVSACGQAPTPTATPDIPATAAVYANTMVAATLTAQPTRTLVPTATPMPTATATIAPTDTQPGPSTASDTATPVATQALAPQVSPTVFQGTFSPGDISGLPTANLEIDNLSGEKQVIVSLTCHTATREQVVYYNQTVTKKTVIQIVLGKCDVLVQIPNKRYMSMTFSQTNKDKTTMGVYLTKITVHGP